jgi:hypothetical protein
MRLCLKVLVPVIACVGLVPAQAAPVSGTFALNGTVAGKCSLQNVIMSPSVSVTNNSNNISVNSPSTWTLTAGCSGPSSLAVTAKSLRITAPKTSVNNNEAQTINYTATAAGWTTTAATVTTADSALGSATYSITGTSRSRTTPGSATIDVSFGTFVVPTMSNGNARNLNQGTYSATITLSLSPAS